MSGMTERVILKLTSARFVITVIMSLIFAYLAVTEKLNTEFCSVYMLIISFYFSKKRDNEETLTETEAETKIQE